MALCPHVLPAEMKKADLMTGLFVFNISKKTVCRFQFHVKPNPIRIKGNLDQDGHNGVSES